MESPSPNGRWIRGRMLNWAKRLVQSGCDFAYPRTCHWCATLLPEEGLSSTRFCQKCRLTLAPVPSNRCQRCSAPVGPHLETSQGCIHCRSDPRRYHQIISLGAYQHELQKACLLCKKPGRISLANALTELLIEQNQSTFMAWDSHLVIPVPHHWRDRLWSEHATMAISERLGQFLKRPVERHLLLKVRRTRRQQQLSAKARKTNLREAFRVSHPNRLKGKRVLLADDILTTGITADHCAQVLLKAGAAQVNVAVLARGIGG